jgi:protoporphyrinogen oxidase
MNLGPRKKSFAVIGGGMMGIVAAIELARSGLFEVTLYEREKQLGGLSSYYEWEDIACDKFYHVVLSTDWHLLDFLKDLGLDGASFFRETRTGFFGNGRLVSLSSIRDFVDFPFLTIGQKIRLGAGLIYCVRLRRPPSPADLTAESWLTRVFGGETYRRVWRPLLKSKFATAADRTPASLIWATIRRLYGARGLVSKTEKLGYVRGGYRRILEEAENKLSQLKVNILRSTEIQGVAPDNQGRNVQIFSSAGPARFDGLLLTIPTPEIVRIVSIPDEHPDWARQRKAEYHSVLCVLLVLDRRLSPYYAINLLDDRLPFTGVIETTNVISPEVFGGRHLLYLPKYLAPDDPLVSRSDEQIIDLFLSGLRLIFGGLRDSEIVHRALFRERFAQPLLPLCDTSVRFFLRSPLANVYISNNSFICGSTVNNNAVIDLAKKAAQLIIAESL